MVKVIGITVFAHGVVQSWWQWGLVGVLAASGGLGLLVTVVVLINAVRHRRKSDNHDAFVPRRVADRFLISASNLGCQETRRPAEKPSTFGVFLGSFESPQPEYELQVLSRYDLLILNPAQRGVREAIADPTTQVAPRVVARLDIRQLAQTTSDKSEKTLLQLAERVVRWVEDVVSIRKGGKAAFTGVIIAGWHGSMPTSLLNTSARYIGDLGLEVYLEIVPPHFLEDVVKPNVSLFDGVVVKNGTVLPNGEVRDFFQMEKLKSTTREFVSQSCLRNFTVMMWDMVDDRIDVSHAVVKRSFNWCSYHGAIVWIGPEASLNVAESHVPVLEPIAAFLWLKGNDVMKIHDQFRTTRLLRSRSPSRTAEFERLQRTVPSMSYLIDALSQSALTPSSVSTLVLHRREHSNSQPKCDSEDTTLFDASNGTEWVAGINKSAADPLSISATGINYTGFGCFPVGMEVTGDAFAEIVKSQRRLRRLGLLTSLAPEKVRELAIPLKQYISSLSPNAHTSLAVRGMHDLSELLLKASDLDQFSDPVQIFLGIDSGFHGATGSQFWGVYETDRRTGAFVLYISKNAQDLLSTIVHTYLSSRALSRYQCFLAELDLYRAKNIPGSAGKLPDRLRQDLDLLSPTEHLLLIQQFNFSTWNDYCPLLSGIILKCEEMLIDVPSFLQLKHLGNVRYIEDSISPEELVRSRVDWYRQHGFDLISDEVAIEIFSDVHFVFRDILHFKLYDDLNNITSALQTLVLDQDEEGGPASIDPYTDILAFAVFCAARKAAFEEIYVEVQDRNPLFNEFSDQSAAMAELFALGSRCEAYFDVSPSAFGKLLSDRHRAYYSQPQNQPPMWIHNAPAFASAYAAAQTDIDPNQADAHMPGYRRFTFLSVFAIPALVDIILLTTTGRGLYLSAFMADIEKENATLALMLSLLISGAIGTWISIGGTYYLISMAFSAANMFILTRLVGGLAFTVLIGLVGFVAISASGRDLGGLVFFLYLIALTAYLSVLAALSSFQFPGSAFLNGRGIIIAVLPTLLISPIVTMFFPNHDIVIYLVVLYIFIGLLILGLRHVGAQWVTWLTTIKTVDDAGVKAWYIEHRADGRQDAFAGLTDPAAMTLSRQNLDQAVKAERMRPFWRTSTADPLVKKLAGCWEATTFLLNWYCRLSDVKKPMPYTSTWNIEVRVAYDSLLQNQKGIRLHNSFIHWRNAGDEIVCGVLYFIVALLDRWVELIYGGPLVGLSNNSADRVAVGFGLAYYLIGAVLLDYKAQHLHQVAQEMTPVTIQSKEYIRAAELYDAKVKRKLYWTTLLRFLGVHVWALALSAGLVWVLDGNKLSFTTFLCYVAAYTGLMLYQYNKIFSGPHALMPLVSAVAIGLPFGLILKKYNNDFAYNDVLALGAATWIAAILSIKTAKIGMPRKAMLQAEKTHRVFHAYGGLGIDQKWSQSELEAFYEGIMLDDSSHYEVQPSDHPGSEIQALLLSCNEDSLSALAVEAFPEVRNMMPRITNAWERGLIKVTLARMHAIIPADADVRALSYYSGGRLHILVESDSEVSTMQRPDISSNSRVIAETLIHAAGEAFFGFTHDHALISESLLVCRYVNEEITRVPERLRRTIPSEITAQKKHAFLVSTRKELLKSLCYGLPCDTNWDDLPVEVRSGLLARCVGSFAQPTEVEINWLEANLPAENGCLLESRIARFDLGAILAVHKLNYFRKQSSKYATKEKMIIDVQEDFQWLKQHENIETRKGSFGRMIDAIRQPLNRFFFHAGQWVKFIVISPIGDPEYQRELVCAMSWAPRAYAPARWLLTGMWQYSRIMQSFIFPWFIFKNRDELHKMWKSLKGTRITLKKDRLTIQAYSKTMTAFYHRGSDGTFKMFYYQGMHEKEPKDGKILMIGTYDKDLRLTAREEFKDGHSSNEFVYEYPRTKRRLTPKKISRVDSAKIPLSRVCVRGADQSAAVQYNHKGFVESGSYLRHGNLVRFKYHYRKNAKYEDELLRAEFVLPHLSCNVSWAAPPVRHPEKPERWIPHSRVQEATFVQGSDVYECDWVYNHQYHPTIMTKLNGQPVETPEMIRHDWLGLLKKPTGCNYLDDNPLLSFGSLRTNAISRFFRFNSKLLPSSTSQKRSELWRVWKKRTDIDGVVIRWLDERLLREDPLLKSYWTKRDRGALVKAEDYLALHADTIMASSELSNDISAWTPLALRLSDLFSFGQGGDAVVFTRTKTLQPDTEDTLHVVAVDTGTWPNEGGGVSACRRDLINNLKTIRWHMVVESANDFGLPKHQTQENVESLKIIPLWGLDFMHPVHGMFFNKLDSEVDHLIKDATRADIMRNFLPTLTALVKGARAIILSDADVKQATRALVNLNTYFQDSRHWKEVWESDTVKECWRQLWLADDLPNTKAPSQWFDTERPTLGHLDTALELWFRYLFIFSIPIPERVPAVFQASHHSVSAAYGIVCKIKRNCVLQIWDHAISWRETNLYLSSGLCTMPPFIRNSLLGLMRLTSMLTLHHADHILPCADFFNPGWEVEIGTSQGTVEHRNVFKRKIDPVVNGITDMQKFAPVSEITTKRPTVTMLSHLWFAKDIKTALLAADIIVNQWGFKDYVLDVYGALNKAPIYSSECQEIIATKGIATNVQLRGTADPGLVLSHTWVFLNSSVSEGLPLALGEAALTGAPVVCTDVGASLRVLTNPKNNEKYSEIVAPNDPLSLARAQINLLAMIDQWSKYAGDTPENPAPILPVKPTADDVRVITQRMYDKTEQRRALGMMARSIVQESFSGERYLREHEQMLWVGKARYESYGIPQPPPLPPPPARSGASINGPPAATQQRQPLEADAQLRKMAHPHRPHWIQNGQQPSVTGTSFTSLYTDQASDDRLAYPASVRLGNRSVRDEQNGPVNALAMLPHGQSVINVPDNTIDNRERLEPYQPPNGNGSIHDPQASLPQRPSSAGRLSYATTRRETGDMQRGMTRKGSSARSYVPTLLSEVQNARPDPFPAPR